ncbi:MAG: flagellar biosynthesis protein FliQ [Hydrogenobaculum sp.]
MSQDQVLTITENMIKMTALLSAPILLTTFIVGLLISVLQSATQIQEITLSYIPKILSAFFVIFLLDSWMMKHMIDYTKELIINIPNYIR